jgi:REP element-mobilizing transposase RayT
MTAPRQVLPGTVYMLTRRCSQQQFLLRPSETTNAIFLYVLAVAARRFNVQVHAFCVLSNHFHAVVTDPDACLPAFSQYLDSLVARAVNASLGRWESFWAPSSYSAVALASPADIVDKVAYVLANPVAAGLVARAKEWPGLWSAPESIGGDAVLAPRPTTFFRATGYMPEVERLELVPPPGFTADAFRQRVGEALAVLEGRARETLVSERRKPLGARKVLAQKPTARPAGIAPRRGLRPRVAGRDRWKRIEALLRLVDFLKAYRVAWRTRRAGEPPLLFPAGTYLLRVAHGVPCEAVA